tara:strand:- start:1729 stop:2118 length:390 start_codon:yes stop_codon:yes gene_type:complete
MPGDKKIHAWSEWVLHNLPDVFNLDKRVRQEGNGIIVSDSLYGTHSSIATFSRNQRPFIFGLKRRGAFDYVLKELAKVTPRQGDWAAAWCRRAGLVIISSYPPGESKRRYACQTVTAYNSAQTQLNSKD